jgi:erythromycin esterase-like protein
MKTDTETDIVTVSRECAERAIKNAKVERENSEAAADESLAYRDKASVEYHTKRKETAERDIEELREALEKGHGETKKIGLWLHNLHLILFWFCFSIVILTLI